MKVNIPFKINSSKPKGIYRLSIQQKTGERIAIYGTSLSLILNFVNIPNENMPSKGPYVYPATVNNDLYDIKMICQP